MFDRITVTELPNPRILSLAKTLDAKGWVEQCDDYCYLKIDDRFIHTIQPMLSEYGEIAKPDYFNASDYVGAHISIIYPEERIKAHAEHMGQIHTFTLDKLIKAQYGLKEYYALSVRSPSLKGLRKRHDLSPRPIFKRQTILFHITVGIRVLDVSLDRI